MPRGGAAGPKDALTVVDVPPASDEALPPRLRDGEVAVHRVALDAAELATLLSPEEHARAGRFRAPRDRERFIVAHGRLRAILSAYGAGPPAALRFARDANGKPRLAPPSRLRFNLSHSGALALVAVARDREVGVDIERIRDRPELRAIAGRFFSPFEVAALRPLGGADFVAAFHRCWTRKEAYLKARGLGLALALDSFDVSIAAGDAASGSLLLDVRGDARAAADWDLCELRVDAGYVAAVAAARDPRGRAGPLGAGTTAVSIGVSRELAGVPPSRPLARPS